MAAIFKISPPWQAKSDYNDIDWLIIQRDIDDIVTKLTMEFYPKLTPERVKSLQDGLKLHREFQTQRKEALEKYGPDHPMFQPISKLGSCAICDENEYRHKGEKVAGHKFTLHRSDDDDYGLDNKEDLK